MKPLIKALAIASVLAAALPAAASAAPWQSVNQRQANLEQRIDQGVRTGDLTRQEAAKLRVQFRELSRLETQYRRSGGGLSQTERRDLDKRFDRLSQNIRVERHDRNDRNDRNGPQDRQDHGRHY